MRVGRAAEVCAPRACRRCAVRGCRHAEVLRSSIAGVAKVRGVAGVVIVDAVRGERRRLGLRLVFCAIEVLQQLRIAVHHHLTDLAEEALALGLASEGREREDGERVGEPTGPQVTSGQLVRGG